MSCIIGTDTGMNKQLSFAVVNDLSHIAEYLPRLPDQNLTTYLRREGAKPSRRATFRPRVVNDRIKFLLENSPRFKKYLENPRAVNYIPVKEGVLDEEIESVEMTEEDDAAVKEVIADSERLSSIDTAESDVILLHREDPLMAQHEHLLKLLGLEASEARRALNLDDHSQVFVVPKVPEFASTQTDIHFYENAFPHLFPYGVGGFCGDHGLSRREFLKLLLMRGKDRRFGKSHHFIFALWSEFARKAAGQVAYVADRDAQASASGVPADGGADAGAGQDAATASPATGDAGDYGLRIGDAISELLACPTAEAMIETLEKNDSAFLKKLLKGMTSYGGQLEGSALHIALEKKGLFATLLSPIVSQNGLLSVFGTFAPCDRFNAELFEAISPGCGPSEKDRADILRQYPVLAARIADARVRSIFAKIIEGNDMPFGKISDYWIRVEFQGDLVASSHIYC